MSLYKKIKRKIYKQFHPVIAEIWCLHRVLPQRSAFQSNRELEITPDYLEELILNYKSQYCYFCSIDVIYDKLYKFTRNKLINVSFDDGFYDIYTYAFPILKKYNIPFTIYLTTDLPDKKSFLWWVILERIILEHDELTLINGNHYKCKSMEQKQNVYDTIMQHIYMSEENMSLIFRNIFYDYLAKYEKISDELVLSWSQLKEMSDSGLCTVGSHSISHPALTKLSLEDAWYEITASSDRIFSQLGYKAEHISYPHSFYNENLKKLVEKAGYKTATIGYGGSIRCADNRFSFKRNYIVQP